MKCMTENRLAVALCIAVSLLLGIVPAKAQEREERKQPEEGRGREQAKRRERNRGDRENAEREGRRERRRDDRNGDDGEPRNFEELVNRVTQRLPERGRNNIMEFAHEHFDDVFKDAKRIFAQEMDEAVEMVMNAFRESMELLELREMEPEEFERAIQERRLEREAEALARHAAQLEGEVREKTIAQLRKLLSESFELRQENMRRQMGELERELARLKTLVEKRQQHRDLVIERRIKDLTGEPDHLQW